MRQVLAAQVLQALRGGWAWLAEALRLLRKRGPSQFQFWLIALVIGIAAGAVQAVLQDAAGQLLFNTTWPLALVSDGKPCCKWVVNDKPGLEPGNGGFGINRHLEQFL